MWSARWPIRRPRTLCEGRAARSAEPLLGVVRRRDAGQISAPVKFSLIGALRAAGQLIAYELPLVLVAAAIVMESGTLSLIGIVEAQRDVWNVVYPWHLVGFVLFMVASLAELTRSPSICRSRTRRSSSGP